MAPKKSSRSTLTKAEHLHFGPSPTTKGKNPSSRVPSDPAILAEDEDSESRQESVTPAGRRGVRSQFLPVSHPKKRPRVSDDLETVEATAPQGMWVAVGEDRCKPCKMVGREVCKPEWSAGGSCKSCVFCTGRSWPCNPPDSWLENVASILHPKQPQTEAYEVAADYVSIEAEESLGRDKASPPAVEAAVPRRQSGLQKDGRAQEALNSDHWQEIETRMSAIETMAQELTQATSAMAKAVKALSCNCNEGTTPSLHSSISAHSTASSGYFPLRPSPPAQDVVAKGQRPGVEGSPQQSIGGFSHFRNSAHVDARPLASAGTLAEAPQNSPVVAGCTPGSAKEVFLPGSQNGSTELEAKRRLLKDYLGTVVGELEEVQGSQEASILALDGVLTKISGKLQDAIQILC